MAETFQFGLPLVAGAQAQKHVTVNEALSVLDAVTQLRFVNATTTTPPALAQDGSAYLVPTGAVDDWTSRAGQIAISTNGGWRYVQPKAGWQAFNVATGKSVLFDGTDWRDCAMAASLSGAAVEYKIAEIDHTIEAGSSSITVDVIPERAQVIGVTGRIIGEVSGSFASWTLGVSEDPARYASGLGGAFNSFIVGMSGTPLTYYTPTPLVLTAEGGDFAAGTVRIAVHFVTLSPPRPI